MTDEKTGIVHRVSESNGGILFNDEQTVWYNALQTAKSQVKSDLKGKNVTIRLADDPKKFSFLSLAKDQPDEAPEQEQDTSSDSITKDGYWERKEARDLMIDEKISRHGALKLALDAIKISFNTGSSGAAMKSEDVLTLAEQFAKERILPFIEGKKQHNAQ